MLDINENLSSFILNFIRKLCFYWPWKTHYIHSDINLCRRIKIFSSFLYQDGKWRMIPWMDYPDKPFGSAKRRSKCKSL